MEPLILDADGLPWSGLYEDHYFSRHDGRAEASHVFLSGNDLPQRWEQGSTFTIGELGFGTGLNILETWRLWREHRRAGQRLELVSMDLHPLEANIAQEAVTAWDDLAPLAARLYEGWNDLAQGVQLDDQTFLRVVHAEALSAIEQFPKAVDAWFLDGFSPAKNPAMWSAELMAELAARTASDGTFASYTAAGWVRRNLEEAGFCVERCPGYGRKRHMIRGHLA